MQRTRGRLGSPAHRRRPRHAPPGRPRSRRTAGRRVGALGAAAAPLLLLLVPGVPAQDGEYTPGGQAWNGLSALVELGAAEGLAVLSPRELDLDTLTPQDALLVVHPTRPLPRLSLTNFMRGGGRIALADDYGSADSLLGTFGIARAEPTDVDPDRRLRGNRNLLLATPEGGHPLTNGVQALVANHARVLRHRTLEPVFGFGEGAGALVLSGAVGAGRLVTIGDPSVLINNMLELSGNRRFARNLLRYLTPEGAGRIWLVTDATILRTEQDQTAADPIRALRKGLGKLSEIALPPLAVRVSAWVLALSLLGAAVTSLPRRTEYARAMPLRTPGPVAGFLGRVRFFAAYEGSMLAPLLAFKLELEETLAERLALPPAAGRAEVIAALRRRDLSDAQVQACDALLEELSDLHAAHDDGRSTPRVTQKRFQALVATGTGILASLAGQKQP